MQFLWSASQKFSEMKTIKLTQGKAALVDDADFERVKAHKWHALKSRRGFYAVRGLRKSDGKKTLQYLHRFLLPGVAEIDHRDGNGLNNQRENLRPVTHQQNMQGFQRKRLGATSKFRGVSWYKNISKWEARIQVSGKRIFLGHFTDETKAARAYDAAARHYFGDSAYFNFPLCH